MLVLFKATGVANGSGTHSTVTDLRVSARPSTADHPLVLIACGGAEIAIRTRGTGSPGRGTPGLLPLTALPAVTGGVAALCWVALKVGALSYGGGFVIIPLMQHDAVVTYHWVTGAQFLNAVALGQVTPGPVVQTVAVVGYAASGLWGGLLAAAVALRRHSCSSSLERATLTGFVQTPECRRSS